MKFLKSRYSLLLSFIAIFLIFSFFLRIVFVYRSWAHAELSWPDLAEVFLRGSIYDLSVALFFAFLYALYLLLLPFKWNNSLANRLITYAGFSLALLLCMFSFFAEFTFWKEFESRFNFIAVDY